MEQTEEKTEEKSEIKQEKIGKIIKYSCSCKTKEVPAEEFPDWPWFQSGDRVCAICRKVIAAGIIDEGDKDAGNIDTTNIN